MHSFFSRLSFIIFALITFYGSPVIMATPNNQPIEIITWAPIVGSQSNWYDALEGLKASAAMFNANGGIGGRELVIKNIIGGERNADFLSQLAALAENPTVAAVVGGPNRYKSNEISNYIRRVKLPWFGPWSHNREIYRDDEYDPFAILPTWREEIPAILTYIKQYYDAFPNKNAQISLIYIQSEDNQNMSHFAMETALNLGLKLKTRPLSSEFSEWAYLAGLSNDSQAVILWLPCGSAAALIRELKIINADRLFITNSTNATNTNMVTISNGAWNGIIFPSVLIPSSEIHQAYRQLLKKYGAPGLKDSYQALVGLSQGQVLAKALSEGMQNEDISWRDGFYGIIGFESLFHSPANYRPGRHLSPDIFYLARAYGAGQWEAAPIPGLSDEQPVKNKTKK